MEPRSYNGGRDVREIQGKPEETLEAKEELAPRNKVKWTDTYYGGP